MVVVVEEVSLPCGCGVVLVLEGLQQVPLEAEDVFLEVVCGCCDLEEEALDGLQHDDVLLVVLVVAAEAMLEYLSLTAWDSWVASIVGRSTFSVISTTVLVL